MFCRSNNGKQSVLTITVDVIFKNKGQRTRILTLKCRLGSRDTAAICLRSHIFAAIAAAAKVDGIASRDFGT